jgi:hypothetical protein
MIAADVAYLCGVFFTVGFSERFSLLCLRRLIQNLFVKTKPAAIVPHEPSKGRHSLLKQKALHEEP